MIIGSKSKTNNVFSIHLTPLYTNMKTIYNLIDKKAEQPTYKIITKNQLLSFDASEGYYFNNFFEFINSKFEPNEDKLQYLL